MSAPDITDAEIDAVVRVLRSDRLSLGPRVAEFEELAAACVGARHAIAVSSGTAALHLATIAAGIGAGDLAITTPFSFVASANCLLYEGAEPVFVDVDPVTGNIDPARVAEQAAVIANGPKAGRLKALIPVHTFGQAADMDPLCAVAREHGLAVIEDACEAIGTTYRGRPVGSLGDVGAFAFYPNKQMTTGEGGMLVTSREEWKPLFHSLRNQGRDSVDAWLAHSRLGYNYRLDEMSGALGAVQLLRLDELLAKRGQVADWYMERLASHGDLVQCPAIVDDTTRMSWFVYVVRVPRPVDRDSLMRALEERGIPSRAYFAPIHLQPFYRARFGFQPGDYPVAEDLGRRSLALPFSSLMSEAHVEIVCRELLDELRGQLARGG